MDISYVFLKVFYMSIAGSIAFLLVKLLHILARNRTSKKWLFYSWSLVAVVLMLPVSLSGYEKREEYGALKNDSVRYEVESMEQNINKDLRTKDGSKIGYGNDLSSDSTLSIGSSQIINIVAYIWLGGLIVLFTYRIAIRCRYHKDLRKNNLSNMYGDEWALQMKQSLFEEAALLNYRKIPRICISTKVSSPMIFGILVPTIYLPALKIDEKELHLVLRHELTHYKRKDLAYKEFIAICQMFHWFNPMLWLINKEVDRDCELVCDECVIKAMERAEKKQYSKVILKSIYKERHMEQFAMANLNKNSGLTEERIREIMRCEERMPRPHIRIGIMLLSIGVVIGSLGTSIYVNGKNKYEGKNELDKRHINVENRDENSAGIKGEIDKPEESSIHKNEVRESEKSQGGQLPQVVPKKPKEQETQQPEKEQGIEVSISDYLQHPKKYKQSELDRIITDYIENTNDIGAFFCVSEYLSQSAVDTIAIKYLRVTKDMGIYETILPYLSTKAQGKAKKIFKDITPKTHTKKIDSDKNYTNKNYTNKNYIDQNYIDNSFNGVKKRSEFTAKSCEMKHKIKKDFTGSIKIKGTDFNGSKMLYDGTINEIHTAIITYKLTVKKGSIKIIYDKPNNLSEIIIDEIGEGEIELPMLNGKTKLYIAGTDAEFNLTLSIQ